MSTDTTLITFYLKKMRYFSIYDNQDPVYFGGMKKLHLFLALIFLALLSVLGALLTGSVSNADLSIIYELRLPRVLTAFAVGGLLAMSGAVLQVLTRNPLAESSVLGVSGGASVGALGVLITAGFTALSTGIKMMDISSIGKGLLGIAALGLSIIPFAFAVFCLYFCLSKISPSFWGKYFILFSNEFIIITFLPVPVGKHIIKLLLFCESKCCFIWI